MKKFFQYCIIAVIICALSAVTSVLTLKSIRTDSHLQTWANSDSVAQTLPAAYGKFVNLPEAGETDFTVAAELSVGAVVHVKTTIAAPREAYSSDPFFEFFFGRPQQQREVPDQMASGSGVIISTDGYIVTNNHVIKDAKSIEVVLNDKRSFVAELIGTDPNTDIALLKIDAHDLPVIIMGNSDNLRVGEWVLAVGNPFNLTSTVTAGIVSAKARNINILDSEMKIESFIQTDAAVNPGNSGGALVNTRGELVGINTAIASRTGSYSGYSFAVPTSIVQKVVADLKQYGIVQRAILGVQIQDITSELKAEKHLTTLQGAYIANVIDNGAADKAGIKAGDVVISIGNAAVKSTTDLQELVGRHRPGDIIEVGLLRNGKQMTFRVELTNKSGGTGLIEKTQDLRMLGAQFKEVSPQLKQKLGITYGLQIAGLKKGKLSSAGIPENFIILKVNNRAIRTEEDLQEVLTTALQANEQDKVLFLAGITPTGKVAYYAINLSE
ncbi:MAG: Do family serine endopeptidase [Paludibacter sp.]|nr:Do family serine endopeptidase [Bacteroidales bacterium]MCM1068418.1 Do family serine endopeptidase [Prevotella sp.]MCM1353373.1 Do family serine endopeptidase [Bacteroides sp.]MCM1442534.1 Do family serine endopeptidase [Muribaculum sp.]MCM1481379.1 Do family serine endopeptidase [Paludibacter sp.]